MATEIKNNIEWVKRKTAYCTHWLATNKAGILIEVVQRADIFSVSFVFAYRGGVYGGDLVHTGGNLKKAFNEASYYFNSLT